MGMVVAIVGFMKFKGWIDEDVFSLCIATMAGGGLIAAADARRNSADEQNNDDTLFLILNEVAETRKRIEALKPSVSATLSKKKSSTGHRSTIKPALKSTVKTK